MFTQGKEKIVIATIKQCSKKVRMWLQDQRGISLVELLVALAIMGIAAVAFIVPLSTGAIAVRDSDEGTVAQSLAKSQLEYTKSYPYNSLATTYPTVVPQEGYGVSVNVSSVPGADVDIQKITVTVSRDGNGLLVIEDYKVDR